MLQQGVLNLRSLCFIVQFLLAGQNEKTHHSLHY